MTKQILTDAIAKLEEAQETLRTTEDEIGTLVFLKNSQQHYEIGKAISQLQYTLSKL